MTFLLLPFVFYMVFAAYMLDTFGRGALFGERDDAVVSVQRKFERIIADQAGVRSAVSFRNAHSWNSNGGDRRYLVAQADVPWGLSDASMQRVLHVLMDSLVVNPRTYPSLQLRVVGEVSGMLMMKRTMRFDFDWDPVVHKYRPRKK